MNTYKSRAMRCDRLPLGVLGVCDCNSDSLREKRRGQTCLYLLSGTFCSDLGDYNMTITAGNLLNGDGLPANDLTNLPLVQSENRE